MSDDGEQKKNANASVAIVPAKTSDAEAIALSTAASILGIPVPPTIAKNLIDSTGALLCAALDVPTAALQRLGQWIRVPGEARGEFMKGSVPIALKQMSDDPEKMDRALMFLGNRMLREQTSRVKVVAGAVEDLRTNPPKEDASCRIDEDWLHMFARLAETKTNADVQAYFSRVLAGEIRKPGSFAPETIEVLAKITPEVASIFQGFCGMTAELNQCWLLAGPFGDPGQNALAPVGLPYDTLCRLGDAGLVRVEVAPRFMMPPNVVPHIEIGGQNLNLEMPDDPVLIERASREYPFTGVRPTAAGAELRKIVHMTPNEVYVAAYLEWIKVNWGIVPASCIAAADVSAV